MVGVEERIIQNTGTEVALSQKGKGRQNRTIHVLAWLEGDSMGKGAMCCTTFVTTASRYTFLMATKYYTAKEKRLKGHPKKDTLMELLKQKDANNKNCFQNKTWQYKEEGKLETT